MFHSNESCRLPVLYFPFLHYLCLANPVGRSHTTTAAAAFIFHFPQSKVVSQESRHLPSSHPFLLLGPWLSHWAGQLCWVGQLRSAWFGVSQHRDRTQPQAAACRDCGTLQGLGLMLKQWPLSLQVLSCTRPWHHQALQCHWCLLFLLWDQRQVRGGRGQVRPLSLSLPL